MTPSCKKAYIEMSFASWKEWRELASDLHWDMTDHYASIIPRLAKFEVLIVVMMCLQAII